MEFVDIITELLSNLGFPVAMVVYFIWDKTKITSELTEAINNNNIILTRILEHFSSEDNNNE